MRQQFGRLLAVLMFTMGLTVPTSSVAAQAAATAPPPVIKPTATLEGVVKTAGSAAPLAGACITVGTLAPRALTCTGVDGRYSLRLPAEKLLLVGVTAAGYRPLWLPNNLDVEAGGIKLANGEKRQADFVLGGSVGTLSGVAKRQDGTPDRFPSLSVYPVGSSEPIARIHGRSDGTFSRSDIAVGSYQVLIQMFGYPDQWYPAASTRAGATTVTVAADQTVSLDVTAIPKTSQPNARLLSNLEGQVASAGQPVPDAVVTVYRARGQVVATTTTNAEGRYSVPGLMADGSYAIKAAAPGMAVTWAKGRVAPETIYMHAGVMSIYIDIPQRVGIVRGTVADFDSGDLPYWLSIILVPVGADPYGDNDYGWVPVNFDGTYEIRNVPVGDYWVRIWTGRGSAVEYQFHGDTTTAEEATVVSVRDGQTQTLQDKLFPPSFVEVTVRDEQTGELLANACLYMHQASKCTDASGIAMLGPYWHGIKPHAVTVATSQTLDRFAASQNITVTPGQVTSAELSVEVGAGLEIPVTTSSGGKVEETICVSGEYVKIGRPKLEWATKTDDGCRYPDDGVIRIGPFKPGTVRLLVYPQAADSKLGAQWLGESGGSGLLEKAKQIPLTIGTVTRTPVAKLDQAGQIRGDIYSWASGGKDTLYGACASVVPGVMALTGCTGQGTADFAIGRLGPYEWPVRFIGTGYAQEWLGGKTNRTESQLINPHSGQRISASLKYAGGFQLFDPAFPASGTLTAYDAISGDVLDRSQPGYLMVDNLNDGRVLLHYSSPEKSCWLKRIFGPFRFGNPYFTSRTGVYVSADGSTCTQQEPLLIKPGKPTPYLPRATTRATGVTGKLRGHSR